MCHVFSISLKVNGLLFGLLFMVHPILSQTLKVACTTPVIKDLTDVLGGNMIESTLVTPENLASEGIQTLQNADLVFSNGLSYDTWLEKVLKEVETKPAHIVLTSQIHPLRFSSTADQPNPYAWLDPQNGMVYAHQIKEALIALDPEKAGNYLFNYQLYLHQLTELDSFVQKKILEIPEHKRVWPEALDTFQYFADRYGISLVDSIIPSPFFLKDSLLLDLAEDPRFTPSTYLGLIRKNTLVLTDAMENHRWILVEKQESSVNWYTWRLLILMVFISLTGLMLVIYKNKWK